MGAEPFVVGAIMVVGLLARLRLLFPIVLLSFLETATMYNPFSGLVWRSLVTVWHGWLAFYFLSAVLGVGAVAAAGGGGGLFPRARRPDSRPRYPPGDNDDLFPHASAAWRVGTSRQTGGGRGEGGRTDWLGPKVSGSRRSVSS